MPEFILDHGSPDGAKQYKSLDYFTQGYVEAMFFTNTGTGDDEDLEHATFADLAPETLRDIIADCAAWQKTNATLLSAAMRSPSYDHEDDGYGSKQAGRDYWFSRNGHGVGFWDRGLGAIGDDLHAACQYKNKDLYRGDDGAVYLA